MTIYQKKRAWKIGLFLLAVLIGISSILVTNFVVKSLAGEERKKMEIWAAATREIAAMDSEVADFSFLLEVIQKNETVPVIVVDQLGKILDHRNLRTDKPDHLMRRLGLMKKKNAPIEVVITQDVSQYIYYGDSRLLVWLAWYPYLQLFVILVFLMFAYYAFSVSRQAEENQVWLGMSKETAHQLATPTSSLIAWLELMKEREKDSSMLDELGKDISRLEKITARFSNIGSRPQLKPENILALIDNTLDYLQVRSPRSIEFERKFPGDEKVMVPVSTPLFDWVIENVCKNALDAMEGSGKMTVEVREQQNSVMIDISDTGKGIPRSRFKTIFKPGFTTRRNGWGLGLSLSKRIIGQYHNGKIYVLQSVINSGTTIRIILNKNLPK